ncbi:MAG: hypothetical protein ABI681_07625 [Gemmatimonadales bacterium]
MSGIPAVPIPPEATFPGGKRFAFSIIDDTDDSRIENTRPLYDLLTSLGFRTTKTVWPVDCPEGSADFFAGDTMASAEYRAFCVDLQRRGFEITWHCATMESSPRERIVRGLETFREIFGSHPSVHANHALNRENVYWGINRYRTAVRYLAGAARGRGGRAFEGEVEGSPYFWGDLCRTHMKYVRNFAFRTVDTLEADPDTPYTLESTPWVRYWFSASDAPDVETFCRLMSPAAVDRLCERGGACILATHLGKGYVQGERVDPRVAHIFEYLARLPGWFVPVSNLLDHLIARGAGRPLAGGKLLSLELRHFFDRVRSRVWR